MALVDRFDGILLFVPERHGLFGTNTNESSLECALNTFTHFSYRIQ